MPLSRTLIRLTAFAFVAACFAPPAFAQRGGADPWLTYLPQAEALARRQEKLILIYFGGSDWDPWTKKLDKEVMTTDLFLEWAKDSVLMLKADFIKNGTQPPTIKKQNRELSEKYNVKVIPTVLFINADGQELARATYEQMALRKEEKLGYPIEWVEYCKKIVADPPRPKQLETIDGFRKAMEHAEKHKLALLMILEHGTDPVQQKKAEMLLSDPSFNQFATVSLAVTHVEWPNSVDPSPDAFAFRQFAEEHALIETPLQVVLYDPMAEKIALRQFTFNPTNVLPLIRNLRQNLPHVPYRGEWLTDIKRAQAIAVQQKRFPLISFTDFKDSEFSQKIKQEIYETEIFQEYAKRYLVLVECELPKDGGGLSEELKRQNNTLADMYNVRGFPTLILLNEKGEKLATAGYQKGGPQAMLEDIDRLRREDLARRDSASEW